MAFCFGRGFVWVNQSKPVMGVKEARKRLGKNYKDLSDDQVEYLTELLSGIAKQTIIDLGSKNLPD